MKSPDFCFGTASTQTRVTGYFRPVENFCNGKKAEYMERLSYNPFENGSPEDKQWVKKVIPHYE
jgi:hypothetical protein